ncbi:MAG: metallophosphoesterase family protein [Persicimonas sp.]
MKLAIFSDLHLAADGANQCTASAGELVELCERLEARADRVLVAGDLFNLDRAPVPGAAERCLQGLRAKMPEVVERLERFDWLFGNHDRALAADGVPEERTYEADGRRILALHGHQFDMWLKRLPGLAPTANFVAGWLDRAGLQPVSAAMGIVPHALDRIRTRLGGDGDTTDRGLEGARQFIVQGGWDVVVCGHSHQLRLVPCAGGLFVNTGSLTCGHLEWVLIDTTTRRVEAYRDGAIVQSEELQA